MKKFYQWLENRDPHMAKVIRIVVPLGMVHPPEDDDMPDEPVTDDEPCSCQHKKRILLKDKANNDDHPLSKMLKMLMGK